MMKTSALSIMILLFLFLISSRNKVYASCDETRTSLGMGYSSPNNDKKTDVNNVRDYRVDTINGVKTITLYDRYLGEEQLVQVEFLKSIPKRSLYLYRVLCGNDTVTLLDLNPEDGRTFNIGNSCEIKVRPITRMRVLYYELPSAPLAYCFERDTVWFSRNDTTPKYILIDENVRVKCGQRHIKDNVEVWQYDDGNVIKTLNINGSHHQDSLPLDQKDDLSLYNNLQFENGVCYKTLNVNFLSFGKIH